MKTNNKGATIAEYGILAGLVSVVAITAVAGTGLRVSDIFSNTAAALGDGSATSGGSYIPPQAKAADGDADKAVTPDEAPAAPIIPVTVRGVGDTKVETSNTWVSPTIAPDTVPGDLLVAFVMHRSALTVPEGWTLEVTQQGYTSFEQWTSVLTKPYSESDGASQDFRQAASGRMAGHIVSLGGTDPQIATIRSGNGESDDRKSPSYPVADENALVLSASSEGAAATSGNETISVNAPWIMTTPASIAQNRLAVAWRTAPADSVSSWQPGAVFVDSSTSTDWSAVTIQVTPKGVAAPSEDFGDYTADVDPMNWLILTDGADTATLSGQDGVLAKGGDDMITGTSKAETFIGGRGNDSMSGTTGADKYIYSLGDGQDSIVDLDSISSRIDVLELRGIASSDIRLSQTARHDDAIVTMQDGGSIRIVEHMDDDRYNKIESFVFSDTTWTEQQFRDRIMDHSKTSGNVYGTGLGENYTHTNAKDGSYVIDDESYKSGEIDVLTFTDVKADDAKFINRGYNLNMDINLPGGTTVSLVKQNTNDKDNLIESIVFTGGGVTTTLDPQAVRDKADQDGKPTGTVNGFHYSDRYTHTMAIDGSYKIFEHSYSTSEPDSLTFTDITPSQAKFVNKGYNLDLEITMSDGDVIKLAKQDTNGNQEHVESFIFQGGGSTVTLDHQAMRDKADHDAKSTGVVDGFQHSDRYIHTMATDGSYRILEHSFMSGQPDSLTFTDVTPGQIKIINQGYNKDLEFRLPDGDVIGVLKQDTNGDQELIESFIFQGGGTTVTMDHQAMRDKANRDAKATGNVDGFNHSDNFVHTMATDGTYWIRDHSYMSGQPDTMTFTDVAIEQVKIFNVSTNAQIEFPDGDIVVIAKQFGSSAQDKIETFTFQGGGTTRTFTAAEFATFIDYEALPNAVP